MNTSNPTQNAHINFYTLMPTVDSLLPKLDELWTRLARISNDLGDDAGGLAGELDNELSMV